MDDKTSSITTTRRSEFPEDSVDKRIREIAEVREAEERARKAEAAARQAQQQMSPATQAAWDAWADQRIKAHFEQRVALLEEHIIAGPDGKDPILLAAVGDALRKTRRGVDKDIDAAVAELKVWFEGRIETKIWPRLDALEQRLARIEREMEGRLGPGALHDNQRKAETQFETKIEVKLTALEQRLTAASQAEQQANSSNSQRLATIDQRIECVEHELEGRLGPGALHETQRAAEAQLETKIEVKLTALEQRLTAASQAERQANSSNSQRLATIDQRIERVEHELEGRLGPGTLHKMQCTAEAKFDARLDALEQRLLARPGKLPPAKDWCAESVAYQNEFVCYQGSTFQAIRDTATTPTLGSAHWVCVARGGKDGVDGHTPVIRGTYDAHEQYRRLDVVALDGAAFVACRDNPGICPSDSGGWQMIARQGRPGRKGDGGPAGPKGDKGDPGPTMVSWQIDRPKYRASPLWSNGQVGPNLELHGLYEQYQEETGE